MYILYLTICITSSSLIGFSSTDCATTTPGKYTTKSLCIDDGNSFVRSSTSSNTKTTFTCEKE